MEGKPPEGQGRAGPRPRAGAAALPGADTATGVWRRARLRAGLTLEDLRRALGRAIARESDRRSWFHWTPVAFALGIGAYFLADREPLWWGPPAALVLFAGLALLARRSPLPFAALTVLALASAGLWAASLRTASVAAPVLPRIMIGPLSGFVESVEERTDDIRLVLHVTRFADLPTAETPRRVRITARPAEVGAGQHITLTARLTPPPSAARPGGYDFARDAFFRGFGAVGSALSAPQMSPPPVVAPWRLQLTAAIDDARNAMTARIAGLIGGQAGALAAALVTGKRGLISEDTNEILRAAGLYHIVSISGLHMVLAAGAIFWLARALLALSRTLALRAPVKKMAALAAMAGATAYCVFSGAEVATVRSLLMTLIMLGAILVDRPALSMRNLALAALIVLAREPEALLGPSFQMSFAAVAALIAFAEEDRRRRRRGPVEPGLFARMARGLRLATVGLLVTSLLASAATGPFGAYHFQTYNPFGLIGNMLALPFVSLVVMPAAVIGALLYPLGLDAVAWWIMGLATAPVLAVSASVAGFGGATQVVPAFGALALNLLSAGLLILTLLSTALRFLGLAPLALGAALALTPTRPDIYIDREARGVAVRAPDGRLVLIGRPSDFVAEQWLRADGDGRTPDAAMAGAGQAQGAACDKAGCVARMAGGQSIAWSRDPHAIALDCGRATLVITPLAWRGACAALLVDRDTLDRHGAMAILAEPAGLRAITSQNPDAPRPWTRSPPTARAQPLANPSPPADAPPEDVNSDERD